MARSFRIRLFSQHPLSDPKVLEKVWRHLDSPLVTPTKFDSVERARREFRADAAAEAAELFDRDLHLFVVGDQDDFLAVFTRPRPNLFVWTLWLDAGAMEGERRGQWLTWLFELCEQLPVLYGFGCTADEYDAKHATKRVARGGGAVTGEEGSTLADFFKFLPGVYWLTVFGPELVGSFGAERLQDLPGTQADEIGGGQVAVRLDEPPAPDDMEARLRKERELADGLGAEFFFDPDRDPSELRQVPELADALEADDA